MKIYALTSENLIFPQRVCVGILNRKCVPEIRGLKSCAIPGFTLLKFN